MWLNRGADSASRFFSLPYERVFEVAPPSRSDAGPAQARYGIFGTGESSVPGPAPHDVTR